MAKRDKSLDGLIQTLVGEVARQLNQRVAEMAVGPSAAEPAPHSNNHQRNRALEPGVGRGRYRRRSIDEKVAEARARAAHALANAPKPGAVGRTKSNEVDRRFGPRPLIRMICRVDGCQNPTPGAFHGFMCRHHRATLTPEQQRAARKAFKAKHKGEPLLRQAPPAPKRPAQLDDDRPWYEPPPHGRSR